MKKKWETITEEEMLTDIVQVIQYPQPNLKS